jgi:adenosylcobinamide-phosphate synthase
LIALLVDAAVGWPAWLHARIGHPVGGFARLIGACEAGWNEPSRPSTARRWAGVATAALVIATGVGAGWAATIAAHALFGPAGWLVVAVLAWPGLAQRSLNDHVRPVAAALRVGDLPRARLAVARIVGREVERLDEAGVARAAVESLAESFPVCGHVRGSTPPTA